MHARSLLRGAATAALAAGFFAAGATDAHATHFRYGTLKWEIVNQSGTTVDIKVTTESAWRRSYYGAPGIGSVVDTFQNLQVQSIATNAPAAPQQTLAIRVTAVNALEDWFVGGSTHTFTGLAKSAFPVRIMWQGTARISTLMDGNNDRNFRVEAVMSADFTNLFSPSASILPILNIPYPLPAASFLLPAADADGDALTWSISPTSRSQLFKAAPDGFDDVGPATLGVDPATGLVTWSTQQEWPPSAGQELYSVQFLVRDSRGGEIPIDALLRLVTNAGTPPVAKIDGSENPYTISVNPLTPVTFTVRGEDVDFGATVTLSSGGLPPGASMAPVLPYSGTPPRESVFTWTPTASQAGSHVISFAVTDNFAQQDTNSATIIVLENFQPSLTCPAPATVEATGPSGATHTAESTVADPDGDDVNVRWLVDGILRETDLVPGGVSTLVDFTSGYALGSHALRIEARDNITAPRTCDTAVDIVDTTGPVLSLPASQILEATGPGGADATWPPPTAFDLVDGDRPVTCSHSPGTFPLGTTTVTCSASDLSGNTSNGSFTITVEDTTPPVVTVPADITVEATGPAGAVATFSASAVDLVDGNITPTCAPPSGSTFPLGTTSVTCSATDAHGNTGSASFDVNVVDTTPPVISGMPANMVLEATGPSGAPASWPPPTALDIVDGVVPVTCAPASGSTFPLDVTTTVTCSATDAHGNSSSETFTVRVQDTTPPVISNMPSDMIVPSTGPTGAIVSWPPPTALDLVDGNVPVTCVPPSGSLFPLGTTTVTCTATDAHSNSSSRSFTVTVRDLTPPDVIVTLNPGVLWPPNHKMVNIAVTLQTNEPGSVCTILSVTSNEPVDGRGDGTTAFDWLFKGLDLQLRAERSGLTSGRIYTVTVQCVDPAGNVGTGVATATCPHDLGGGTGPGVGNAKR